jgi:histidine triad (HIT) family protein
MEEHEEPRGPRPCVFCAITGKKIPSKIVYEDDRAVAFLDINPRSTGMTIVAPKRHYVEFDEDAEMSAKVFSSAQTVAMMIKRALSPKAVDFSIIPSQEVPHFHIRIYPVYEGEVPLAENQPKHAEEQELEEIAVRIRVEKPVEEVKVPEPAETPAEPDRTQEEIDFIKRELDIA